MRIARGYLTDYKQGRVSHKTLCSDLIPVLTKIPYSMQFSSRHRVLAWILEEANKITPSTRKKGQPGPPPSVRKYAISMVRAFIQDDYNKTKAIALTTASLRDAGLGFVTAAAVRTWHYKSRKPSQ